MPKSPPRRSGADTTSTNEPHPLGNPSKAAKSRAIRAEDLEVTQPTEGIATGPRRSEAAASATSSSASPASPLRAHLRSPITYVGAVVLLAASSFLGMLSFTDQATGNVFTPWAAAWSANLVGDVLFAGGLFGTYLIAAGLAIRSRRERRPGLAAVAMLAALGMGALTFIVAAWWTVGAGQFIEFDFQLFGDSELRTHPVVSFENFFAVSPTAGGFAAALVAPILGGLGLLTFAVAAPFVARLVDRRIQPVVPAAAPKAKPSKASSNGHAATTNGAHAGTNTGAAGWAPPASVNGTAPTGATPTAGATGPTDARRKWDAMVSAGLLVPKRLSSTGVGEADHALHDADPHKWVKKEGIDDTAEVKLPELLIDEVIGQEEAVEVAKKAARQRRHLLLLGDPGTGKSMIAKAMAQILPPTELDEVLCYPNPKDENVPHIRTFSGGAGRSALREEGRVAKRRARVFLAMEIAICTLILGIGVASLILFGGTTAIMILVFCIMGILLFVLVTRQMGNKPYKNIPNLMIERQAGEQFPPYVDATGSHAGALLGDVRHDPFQSGGLQTPTHQRVEPGAIHRAHKGLLFIDEINVLRLDSQQALLTALQDRKYGITGQSEKSSGAQTKTEPVPCDFILVAAGNMDVIAPTDNRYTGLHPALRSRIRGYGYEVYVKSVMEDTDENRRKLVRFVAQEVRRDGRVPHFDGAAVAEVLREAQRRSGHTGKLTLRLRELGGLVRTAGDIARDDGAAKVGVDHVLAAKRMSMSLEYQVTRRGIEVTTAKEALTVGGERIGCAVGAAFLGTGETGEPAGIVVPVEADATPTADRQKGTLFLGGGLEKDAGVADTVSAVMKRLRGAQMADVDVHAQALLEQPGANVQALEAATVLACISALEHLPVRQDTVVVGEVAVGGRIRAVEGITQMIEGAADLGYKRAIVPKANEPDILLEHRYREAVDVVLVDDVAAMLKAAVPAKAKGREATLESLLHRHAVKPREGAGKSGKA